MAKKPPTNPNSHEKYRQPRRTIGVKAQLLEAAQPYLDENMINITDFVNACVVEKLKALGFWPPKQEKA